jgi:hypothetical protein
MNWPDLLRRVKGCHPSGQRAFRPDAFSEIIKILPKSAAEKRQMEKTLEKVSFHQLSSPACPLELGSGVIKRVLTFSETAPIGSDFP